jgi:hypothetical protein
MSGLHVHALHVDHGHLVASIADETGRSIDLNLTPPDHPALDAAWVRFCEALVAAAQTVMLDLLDSAGACVAAPDTVPPSFDEPTDVPCRICGAPVAVPPFEESDRGEVMLRTYCEDHAHHAAP